MSLDQYFNIEHKEETLIDEIERITGYKLTPFQRKAVKIIEETEKNVIISAPTGAGKTLIGYAALVKYRKGFYLAPLISIMNEKYFELSSLLKRYGYSIVITNRDYRIPHNVILNSDIKIMSPYKFLIYSQYLNPEKHGKVVIVDEFHKLSGDPMFEATITMAKLKGFRIIALSATVTDEDLERLQKWLDAVIVREEKRPVKLEHHPVPFEYSHNIVALREIRVNDRPIVKKYEVFRNREEASAVMAARIFFYTGKPVIVWSPTRNRVEKIAKIIAGMLPEREDFVELSKKIPASNPSERLLKYTLKQGVWIHHGGLSYFVREFVEKWYRKKGGIIVTAYTLSHGVNLPGTFLILSTIHDYRGELLDPSTFHQISGRAGRPGYDDVGIVLTVLVGETEFEVYKKFMHAKASEIKPVLLRNIYTATKLVLPIYAKYRTKPYVMDKIASVLKSSYSYLVDEKSREYIDKLDKLLETIKESISYYEDRWNPKVEAACLMGLHPIEYEAIEKILNSQSYKDAIEYALVTACFIENVEPGEVYDDIMRYGYLSIWFGTPKARTVADTIQTILEAGAFWAARVYGWKSPEREKMVMFAKKFAYAGNERVEPLAREVRIDKLRRMIKSVPQIVEGVSKLSDAYSLVPVAIREAYLFSKRIYRKKLVRLAKLVFYALTGREPNPDELSQIVNESINMLKSTRREVEIV